MLLDSFLFVWACFARYQDDWSSPGHSTQTSHEIST